MFKPLRDVGNKRRRRTRRLRRMLHPSDHCQQAQVVTQRVLNSDSVKALGAGAEQRGGNRKTGKRCIADTTDLGRIGPKCIARCTSRSGVGVGLRRIDDLDAIRIEICQTWLGGVSLGLASTP